VGARIHLLKSCESIVFQVVPQPILDQKCWKELDGEVSASIDMAWSARETGVGIGQASSYEDVVEVLRGQNSLETKQKFISN